MIKVKNILEELSNRQKSYSLLYHTLEEQEDWFVMIQENQSYESMIREIKAEAKRLLNEPIEEMSYVLFKEFEEKGSRIAY